MAVFTSRGLKLRLSTPYVFALITRVFPKVDAFRVLQTTEAVENLARLAIFLAAIVAFSLSITPVQIGVLVFSVASAMHIVHLRGLFLTPILLLLPVSRVYGFLSGYGILLIGLLAFGFIQTGWEGIAGFLVGRLASGAVFGVVGWYYTRYIHREVGSIFTASERSFFYAYRIEAARLGISTDLTVTDDELRQENWKPAFDDLAVKWPEVVDRFTVE